MISMFGQFKPEHVLKVCLFFQFSLTAHPVRHEILRGARDREPTWNPFPGP